MFPSALKKAIGRDQGPQLWFQANFTPATSGNVTVSSPSFADLSRPSIGVKIVLRYRAKIAVAAYATLNCEAPQNLLNNVYLYGNRARTGATVPWNGSGASLFGVNSMCNSYGVSARQFITSSAGSTYPVRQPRLSSPVGYTIGTADGDFGGIGSWDIQSEYFIPFGPFGGGPLQELLFSQRDADWNRTMALTLTLGGGTTAATDTFGVKGSSGTLAFTAFGSSSGNPSVYVYLIPTLQFGKTTDTQILNMYRSGIMQRNVQNPSTALTASATQAQMALLQPYDTSQIITKAGTVDANGNFILLSDNILTKQYLTFGGKPLVQLNDQWSQAGFYEQKKDGLIPQGYNTIDFIGGGNKLHWGRIFRAAQKSPSTQFILSSDIAGASNQAGEIYQELCLEEPVVYQPAAAAAATPAA